MSASTDSDVMSLSDQSSSKVPLNNVLPLPSEIRNMIYNYALTESEQSLSKRKRARGKTDWNRTKSHSTKGGKKVADGPDPASLNLLLASRQTYVEAYHMYYRENTLRFPSLMRFSVLLSRTSSARLQYIQSLSIEYDNNDELPFYLFPIWRLPSLKLLELLCKNEVAHLDSGLESFLGEVRGLELAKINRHFIALAAVYKPQTVTPWEKLEQKLTWPGLDTTYPNSQRLVDLFQPDGPISERDQQNIRQNTARFEMVHYPGGREGGLPLFAKDLEDGRFKSKNFEIIEFGRCGRAPLKVQVKNY